MIYRITLLFFVGMLLASFSLQAQSTIEIPGIAGSYSFTADQEVPTSLIDDAESFELFGNDDSKYTIEVKKVTDMITVIDIISYFVTVEVKKISGGKTIETSHSEMVIVENTTLDRYRIELENGDEWISVASNTNN